MFNRNGRSPARNRRLTVIAGAAFAATAIALSAPFETPAHAEELAPRPIFDNAFAPFAMSDADKTANGDAALVAAARFADAPVSASTAPT